MGRSIRIIFSGLFMELSLTCMAQQDPQLTQYMYNQNVINPAYVTTDFDVLRMGGQYRAQWVGFQGAPRIFSLFGHFSQGERMEFGFTLTRDEIADGAITEDNFYMDYAYVIRLNRYSQLSFGIKGGFTQFNTDFNRLNIPNAILDEAFNQNVSELYPNFGAGVFYFTDRFYAGLAVPNMLTSTFLREEQGIIAIGEEAHVYLSSGYVFEMARDEFLLKPSILARTSSGGNFLLDFNVNALFYNRFEIGVGYRTTETLFAIANFRITPGIRLGYSYDRTFSAISEFGASSHEISLIFDWYLLGRFLSCANCFEQPRFF